ncbi:MAG: tRNA (adenosine(37)-N6)-threonylcarbamoyltransferase complex ATPase subunit type 1 TsaE, partial [Endomicrobiia bacterium]
MKTCPYFTKKCANSLLSCKNQTKKIPHLKNIINYTSTSTKKTQLFAQNLIRRWLNYSNHIFFLLEGTLGTGKTQFVKGVAKELNIKSKDIHSPTFVFITDFIKKNLILYHMDFYRIEKKHLSKILVDHIEEIQNYTKQ